MMVGLLGPKIKLSFFFVSLLVCPKTSRLCCGGHFVLCCGGHFLFRSGGFAVLCGEVLPQREGLGERGGAVRAHVGTLARVRAHMVL